MKKLINILIFVCAMVYLTLIVRVGRNDMKEQITNASSYIQLLEAERDSLAAVYQILERNYSAIQDMLVESKGEVQKVKEERVKAETNLKKRIEELSQKTDEQINDLFDSTYPTTLKGPLHTIVSDQAKQAVATKIELVHAINDIELCNKEVEGLTKIISLQLDAITNRESILAIKQVEIDLMDKGYKSAIAEYEEAIRQKEKVQRRERIIAASGLAVLLIIMIFN